MSLSSRLWGLGLLLIAYGFTGETCSGSSQLSSLIFGLVSHIYDIYSILTIHSMVLTFFPYVLDSILCILSDSVHIFFMITWWWQCVECRIYLPNVSMSPRQGSPRTHSSSWKQLLGQVEGRVYFPVYIVDVYPQCQWNTECDSDGKFWTIVLHSWGSPEFFSHPPKLIWLFPCVFRHDCSPDETFAF